MKNVQNPRTLRLERVAGSRFAQTEGGNLKEEPMPEEKHLRGVSTKEQRQYEHIKESAQRTGRYGNRAKEVAARTVLKQHKEKGHEKGH